MKYIYVAGPYISHPHHNTAKAIECGNQLINLGLVPIIPHIMSAVWNIHTPRDEEFWLKYTLFLPDGTPTRATVHIAMKQPGNASDTSQSDSSSDEDTDGKGS